MLKRKTLNEIYNIVDEFYPSKRMLKQYKHDADAPLGFLVCLATRVKIYDNVQELISRYKKGQDYSDILNVIFKRLRLHKYQVKRLSRTNPSADHESVKRYCIGLAMLLYVAFTQKTSN